jgi:hypothetical protein
MRKSAAVKLTLVPMLAASALAYAQAPGQTDPTPEPTEVGKPLPFDWSPGAPDDINWSLSPPGLTQTIDELTCDEDPNWELRNDCDDVEASPGGGGVAVGGVVRGGYGHYFWTGGG